jgi:glutamate-1-semialdehyde 2,1-aminomutase
MFETVFFSFSYGGETLSLVAILATIKKLKKYKVHKHIESESTFLINGTELLISKHNLKEYISIFGYPFKSVFKLSGNSEFNPLELKTLLQQECAKRGVLFIGYHLVSYSHKRDHINFTLGVYDEVFKVVKTAIENKNLIEKLEGSVVTQIFKNVGDRSIKD